METDMRYLSILKLFIELAFTPNYHKGIDNVPLLKRYNIRAAWNVAKILRS